MNMDNQAFLDRLRGDATYDGQIAHIERLPARGAVYGKLDRPLAPELATCLEDHGLARLYAHQAAAINLSLSGKNVIIATSSASGKTLCYNIAVMQTILENLGTRAIYLFPTKALAQDQLGKLHELFSPRLVTPESLATFDGDTPRPERADVRRLGRVILTNPDMLHVGILPNHQSWAALLRRLCFVVVDEAHFYRGVFGSHVASAGSMAPTRSLFCARRPSPTRASTPPA
jgi:DEAD/DEAH box helicase domain-containing protein